MPKIADLQSKFFIVGGTLGGSAASYVQRPLDNELLRHLLAGEYCNVLAARQMGKSSLMVRTAEELRMQGVKTATIDITSIGSQVTPSQWYLGLVSRLARELRVDVDAEGWWHSMESRSPVQRFSDFLQDVVLEKVQEPIVIFIDEIDSTLKLDFTDDFFAAIRAMYNARSRDEIYKRLTFVLLGVARPGDLIKDRTRTPYNIGVNIDVTDFQVNELDSFRVILDEYFPDQGKDILGWVLDWTGGQPYLTQKLCSEVVKHAGDLYTKDELSDLVEQLFLGDKAPKETNLVTIRDRVSNSPYVSKMLHVYRRVLGGKSVIAEERSIEQNELKLTGLVKVSSQGKLEVRNRIYAYVFDVNWVKANMPVTPAQRLTVLTSVIAVLAIAVAGYLYYQQQNQTAEIQARTYIDNFNASDSSEVKITSLAGVFGLGNEYATQARDLFEALDHNQKLALFDLPTPANVGNELVVVVGGIYQNVENSSNGNAILTAMANVLEQTNVFGATSLALEINTWLDARDAASKGDYPLAVSLYTRAFEYSQDRESENVAILMERASVYTILKQYADALADYDKTFSIDADRANEIQSIVLGNQTLADYWQEHSSSYPNLLSAMAVPTRLPISTSTPAVTPLPTEITDSKGVTMRLVPAGEFTMGDDGNGPVISPASEPVHQVYLDAYYIDKYEVTNALYKACVDVGACKPPHATGSSYRFSYYGNSEFNNYPVIYLDWYQAQAYCEWRDSNLPTEAQWEKAARGTDKRIYPWGERDDCNKANYLGDRNGNSCKSTFDTTEVGSYPSGVSPYGVYDMAGNVFEWVADWDDFEYYQYSPFSNPLGPDSGKFKVLRGGALDWHFVETYYRAADIPTSNNFRIGFRCAHSINESTSTEITDAERVSSMVLVPAGEFTMGSDSGVSDEIPAHQIYLSAFYIDKYEVTNGFYKDCVRDGVCSPPIYLGSNTHNDLNYYFNRYYDSYPVIYVDWNMANKYCEWRHAQLPTEAQWEKAARGTDGRTYPWGEIINSTYANYGNNVGDTTRSGSYPSGVSFYGAYDMTGNVFEWVADWYDAFYYNDQPSIDPSGPPLGKYKVLRGGSWAYDFDIHSYSRNPSAPSNADNFIGFRCAKDANP